MKSIFKISIWLGLALLVGSSLSSCESYLDKTPDSTISEEAAFKDFRSFQGFVEEIYNCIPDKEKCNWCPSWNWGDDEIFNPEADSRFTHQADLGNFRYIWNNGSGGNWLFKPSANPTGSADFDHSLWQNSWYCIRKANVGLEALRDGKLVSASAEERNLIEGQLYFFRAWWHFELINWFGGLPYIDKAFEANDELNLPRLSYQECADRCAEDFRKAADLLPIDWDQTAAGKATAGKNQQRINKIKALAYLGKCYLWASSPLMEHGAQLGGGQTYSYNTEYATKSAEAFGELLSLVEGGQTKYALVEFNFEDPYNHKKASDALTRYSDLFYTRGQNWLMPGSTETLFQNMSHSHPNQSHWNTSKVFGPKVGGIVAHDNVIHQPTANAVNMYGMANGLPLDDPDSGFDPNFPFKDRDPRFYHDIVFDGFKYVNGVLEEALEQYRYCELFTGGNMRPVANASRTGYFIQTLVPHTCNKSDGDYEWGAAVHVNLPYMRLADVYLMYAEATAAMDPNFSKTSKASNCNLTSVDAVNKIRERCGAGHVNDKFNGKAYMDEIRRERAVELMFEGHRFSDLQRWLLLTEAPYTIKTSQEFDRVYDNEWYTSGENDPRDAQVVNWREEVILERVFGTKHYWLPLPDSEVYLYADFPQNPGW